METMKFEPNEAEIAKRAEVSPSGRAAAYERVDPTTVRFVLLGEEDEGLHASVVEAQRPQKSATYVPPSLSAASSAHRSSEITVRVTNIPLHVTQRDLWELLSARCGSNFTRCFLAFDKEKNKSRGVAYVGFDDQKKASAFAKCAMNIVVDNFKFAVEILE